MFKFLNSQLLKLNYFSLFSIILIIYGTTLALFSVAGFPDSLQGGFFPFLTDKPLNEDGFYMIKVAWNIANNNGISYYNGEPTTGIQPLITFFYSLICWVFIHFFDSNKWILLRFLILVGVISHILFAYLVGLLTIKLNNNEQNNKLAFNISSAITLFSFGLFRQSTQGLETTFYLCGLSYLLIFLIDNCKKGKSLGLNKVFKLGLLSSLLVLIRIDALIILFFIYLIIFLKRKLKFIDALVVFFLTSILVSPWFAYVFKVTGKIVPSSGGSQSALINFEMLGERIDISTKALVSHSVSIFTIGREFLFLGSLSLLCIYILLILLSKSVRIKISHLFKNDIFYAFFASFIILFLTYFISSDAKHFYYRYFTPFVILSIPLLGISIAEIYTFKKIYIYLFSLSLFTMQTIGSLHAGRVGNTHAVSAGYIANNFNSQEFIVGSFQSGVIGFFNDNVINLDGKLDHKSLRALSVSKKNKNFDELINYINLRNINVIIDWNGYVENCFRKLIESPDWEYCKDAINNKHGNVQSVCIRKNMEKI